MGTGKTQVCLQFVVASVASSTRTSACYLHSEPAPLRRLQQLMSARGQSGDCLQRIFMESVSTPTELFESLSWKVPLLLRHASLKLLVIDSIAALFRDGALVLNDGWDSAFRDSRGRPPRGMKRQSSSCCT